MQSEKNPDQRTVHENAVMILMSTKSLQIGKSKSTKKTIAKGAVIASHDETTITASNADAPAMKAAV